MLKSSFKTGLLTFRRIFLSTQLLARVIALIVIASSLILPINHLNAATPIPTGPETKTQKDFDNMYLEWMQRHTVEPFSERFPQDDAAIRFLNNACTTMSIAEKRNNQEIIAILFAKDEEEIEDF